MGADMKWLIGILVVLAALAGVAWYALLDADAPATAPNEFDLAAYRSLVASDAPETLPTDVRIEFVGASEAPSFATESGNFSGERTMTYASFEIVAPGGNIIIDGAVDEPTLRQMAGDEGRFSAESYTRVLDAMKQSSLVLITHEHLDHVMAVARNPEPATLAPHLRLTQAQLAGLPEHAPNGQLAPEIASITPSDFSTPTRIAPGVVVAAAPGHTAGTVVIYVRGASHEYLFIGDIAWTIDSVRDARGRPRFITWIMPGVDPDRPAVLRQLRALHEISTAEPDLIILPAHDDAYLRGRIAEGALHEGFIASPAN